MRIAWGIMGDSRGHLTRALVMAEALGDHDMLFFGGGCVAELAEHGHRVVPTHMPGTVLNGNSVALAPTAANFLRLALGHGSMVSELARELERFRPDLVVSDYEFYLPRAARLVGLPCLSFGHQHVLTRCLDTLPPGQAANRLLTTAIIRLLFSVPERYLVVSFFPARPAGPETRVLPPVLRRDVTALRPAHGEHVVAYMRAGMSPGMLEAIAATGREARVYGLGERPPAGRVRFLPADRRRFLDDLAGAAYVVASGGHNLISEALYLGKSVLAAPAAMFYEQYVNAWHLHRLGLGDFLRPGEEPSAAVRRIEAERERYVQAIAGSTFNGNDEAVRAVLESI